MRPDYHPGICPTHCRTIGSCLEGACPRDGGLLCDRLKSAWERKNKVGLWAQPEAEKTAEAEPEAKKTAEMEDGYFNPGDFPEREPGRWCENHLKEVHFIQEPAGCQSFSMEDKPCRRFIRRWNQAQGEIVITIKPITGPLAQANETTGAPPGGEHQLQTEDETRSLPNKETKSAESSKTGSIGGSPGDDEWKIDTTRRPKKEAERKLVTFEFDEDFDIKTLLWQDFKRELISSGYRKREGEKKHMIIAALFLMARHHLKPREIFGLRWFDLGTECITIKDGAGGKHLAIDRLTGETIRLLRSYERSRSKNHGEQVFTFTMRTLQRAVKEIIGEKYTPKDVARIPDVPEILPVEHPLTRFLERLKPSRSLRPGELDRWKEPEGKIGGYFYPTSIEQGTMYPSKEKTRRAHNMKVSHYIGRGEGR